jgi:hypothetical protein
MVVMNTAKNEMKVKIEKYNERTAGFYKMKNILTRKITDLKDFSVESKETGVYELIR